MYDLLVQYELPAIIIGTKADKIPKGSYNKHKKIIREDLNMRPEDPFIIFSSEKGIGMDEAWAEIKKKNVKSSVARLMIYVNRVFAV